MQPSLACLGLTMHSAGACLMVPSAGIKVNSKPQFKGKGPLLLHSSDSFYKILQCYHYNSLSAGRRTFQRRFQGSWCSVFLWLSIKCTLGTVYRTLHFGLDLSPEPDHSHNLVHSLYFIFCIFHSVYLSTSLLKLAVDTLKKHCIFLLLERPTLKTTVSVFKPTNTLHFEYQFMKKKKQKSFFSPPVGLKFL